MVALALIVSWQPKGVQFSDFVEQAQEGAPFLAVLCVACISQLYVIVMLVIGFIGVSIPPQMVRNITCTVVVSLYCMPNSLL